MAKPLEILENIAVAVTVIEADDEAGLRQLLGLFQSLSQALAEVSYDARANTLLSRALTLLETLLEKSAKDPADAVKTLCRSVSSLQTLLAPPKSRPVRSGTPLRASAAAQSKPAAPPSRRAPSAPPPAGAQPAPEPGAQSRFERDAETVALLGDFLLESEDGLTFVDGMLIRFERAGPDAEEVNAVFRVFHTIKGIAGFLDLQHVVSLAHNTEAMLNRCRDGELALRGRALDLVFESTAAMRKLLGGIRYAVEQSLEFPSEHEYPALLAAIGELGEPSTPRPKPSSRPVFDHELPRPAERRDSIASRRTLDESLPSADAASAAGKAPGAAPPAPSDAEKVTVLEALEDEPAAGVVVPHDELAAPRAPGEPAAAAEAAAAPRPDADGAQKLKETLKVDVERVDSLVEQIGELVIIESMLVNAPELAKVGSVRVRNYLSQLAKVTRDLQDVGMRMRMVPLRALFQRMARLVRDLAHKSDKQVELVLEGEATEMDRSMVEQLGDPLVHMIRNAVDHGLESTADRRRAGKPQTGTVRLSAYHEGGNLVLEIADDGRGLDRKAILAKALVQGLIKAGQLLSDAETDALIFAPGFSTAKQVTEISGRGVGMDVVKRNIDKLRGRVVISSVLGEGTTFKIVLPLTLAIINGMLIACGEEHYIIPTLSVVESMRPEPSMLLTLMEDREMINIRGEILPLLRLERLFGMGESARSPLERLVMILEGVGRRFGLLVDNVITQQQVVIKSLGSGMQDVRHLSGAAILANGQVGLIINIDEIANYAVWQGQHAGTASGPARSRRTPAMQSSP